MQSIILGLVRDFSGVPFSAELLAQVRWAASGALQGAQFDEALFIGEANFTDFEFTGNTTFDGARFSGNADFSRARFFGKTSFANTRFEDTCTFDDTAFFYDGTVFASQNAVQGSVSADFSRITCQGRASFKNIWVAQDWKLTDAGFAGNVTGAARCEGTILLRDAVLDKSARLTLNAKAVDCTGATFTGPLTLRLRNATVDLSHVVLGAKSSLSKHDDDLLLHAATPQPTSTTAGKKPPKLTALERVDASQLVLRGLDLRECRFADVYNLDQLHMVGCTFGQPPQERRLWGLISVHPVARRVIADETTAHSTDPSAVANTYRQLRKALEEGKNEPGAADLYYGEMEMRRNPRAEDTKTTERWLLHAYWLMSGYGLRALRALGWLLTAVLATIILMMGLGLPNATPQPTLKGELPATGGPVTLKLRTSEPELTLPLRQRFTAQRADAALKVVLNSVVFRSSGQNLTDWGTYIEMISRVTEPVLLGLALLAVHGRIKRG